LFEIIGVIVFSSLKKTGEKKSTTDNTLREKRNEEGKREVEELWGGRRNRIPNIFLYLKTYSLKRVAVTADR